jgi:hypothetical protein
MYVALMGIFRNSPGAPESRGLLLPLPPDYRQAAVTRRKRRVPRPESSMDDFVLKFQTVELLETISRIGERQILAIEVKNDLTFSVEIEGQVEAKAMCQTTFEVCLATAVKTARIRARAAAHTRAIPSAGREGLAQELLVALVARR